MEAEVDPQLQWNALLAEGDAAALIAVFREAAEAPDTPDHRSLNYSISAFLESHLFTAALDVDLATLCTTSSLECIDIILRETSVRPIDPREVVSELLSIVRFGSGPIITTYFRLLRVALRQILLDTLRRRKDNGTVEERMLKTQMTMRAWYASVSARISHIICTLSQRDALPQTVKSVNKIQECDSGSEDNDDEVNNLSFSVPSINSDTLEVLLNLLLDLITMTRDKKTTIQLLLMVKAIIISSQSYHKDDNEDNNQMTQNVLNILSEWSKYFYHVNNPQSKDSTSFSNEEHSYFLTKQIDFVKIGGSVTEALLRILPRCEILPVLLDTLENEFRKEAMDGITYNDNERGKNVSDTKILASLRDFKDEKEIMKVLSDNDSNSADDDIIPDSLSLQKIGAMMIILDLMISENSSSCSLFSNSPTTLFFISAPLSLESLKSSSLCTVMSGLTFLFVLLSHIDSYSITVNGELNMESSNINDFIEKSTIWPSFSFRTRKFELIFEVVKMLISIATTCPSNKHRLISREIFTNMLQRCAANLRMLLYSSFLVVTPFASICSLMLHSLRDEWGSSQYLRDQSEYFFLRQMLPRCLIQAQENWLKKVRFGEKSFIDPLIQSINFVRSIIAEDSRRGGKESLFQFDTSGSKVLIRKNTGEVGKRSNSWGEYVRQLLDVVVAPLRNAMAGTSEGGAVSMFTTMCMSELSPLDVFALNMALDGLENQVMCTG
ncbi:hypothetical protein LSM04_005225 [Trypanosoma melophagium]|uniref:uncharacterized protein n=1 Tax=Trypanosoma melophagium TaxID=715481 RepID=UPI003519E01E|nr:hypothetical protein LSM04_005225 [Trypanosoma melophagium]